MLGAGRNPKQEQVRRKCHSAGLHGGGPCLGRIGMTPLYRYIGGVNARVLPVPMMNVIKGGACR